MHICTSSRKALQNALPFLSVVTVAVFFFQVFVARGSSGTARLRIVSNMFLDITRRAERVRF